MTDPHIDRILRESREDGDGRVIASLALVGAFVILCVLLWLAATGRLFR